MTMSSCHKNRPRKMSGFAIVALSVVLAGCHGAGNPESTSLEQSVATQPSDAAQMVALAPGAPSGHVPSQPLAALPDETVTTVRSHQYVNGFRQDVLLKGNVIRSMPNSLTILARTSRLATLDEATPLFKPSEAAIRAELSHQFPHMSMQVVERPSSNAYGPYGLALGRAEGNVHCLYMWQWIDENRLPPDAGVSGPVSVRIRLCRAETNFDAMAALIDRLVIGEDAGKRSTVAGNESLQAVAGPTDAEPAKPGRRKHVKRVAVRPVAEARRDAAIDEPGTPIVFGAANPSPLATDLPPQAYLGPKASKAGTTPD